MRLIDAYNLLVEDGIADNCRYFSELYKYFQFRDEQLLKEYLEFIIQEPVDWIRGFPTKLTTKTSFSKPKTAVIKLLKKTPVLTALGSVYVDKVHDVIWKTYKQHWESILANRETMRSSVQPRMTVIDHFDNESVEEQPVPTRATSSSLLHSKEEDTESISGESLVSLPPELAQVMPTDSERVALLKEVILKLSSSFEPSVSDAFRLLLSHV
jgi:hypothetical protein